MATTIVGTFATRRDAELAVEHLVQEHGIEPTEISINLLAKQTALELRLLAPMSRAGTRELENVEIRNWADLLRF